MLQIIKSSYEKKFVLIKDFLTIGFLKKLPTLGVMPGSGNLLLLISLMIEDNIFGVKKDLSILLLSR